MGLKSAVYNQGRFQIKSGLWWRAYGILRRPHNLAKISTADLTVTTVEILQKFVAFPEYMNFILRFKITKKYNQDVFCKKSPKNPREFSEYLIPIWHSVPVSIKFWSNDNFCSNSWWCHQKRSSTQFIAVLNSKVIKKAQYRPIAKTDLNKWDL